MHNATNATYPKVYAIRQGSQLIFRCAWCGKIHRHGLGSGTRASHCPKHPEDYEIIDPEEGQHEAL